MTLARRWKTHFEVFEQRADGSAIPRAVCGHRHKTLAAAAGCCSDRRSFGGYWAIRDMATGEVIEEREAQRLAGWSRMRHEDHRYKHWEFGRYLAEQRRERERR